MCGCRVCKYVWSELFSRASVVSARYSAVELFRHVFVDSIPHTSVHTSVKPMLDHPRDNQPYRIFLLCKIGISFASGRTGLDINWIIKEAIQATSEPRFWMTPACIRMPTSSLYHLLEYVVNRFSEMQQIVAFLWVCGNFPGISRFHIWVCKRFSLPKKPRRVFFLWFSAGKTHSGSFLASSGSISGCMQTFSCKKTHVVCFNSIFPLEKHTPEASLVSSGSISGCASGFSCWKTHVVGFSLKFLPGNPLYESFRHSQISQPPL